MRDIVERKKACKPIKRKKDRPESRGVSGKKLLVDPRDNSYSAKERAL